MIKGSIVALVTPMFEDGSIDYDSYRNLIEMHIAAGTNAIVAVGTTGESPTVDFPEHNELIRVAVEAAAGRIPIIAGTGSNSTREAIELTEYAASVGAAASLQVVPLLQQTDSGRSVSAFQNHRRSGRSADDSLQRTGKNRC